MRRTLIAACPAGSAFDEDLARRADVLVHHPGGRLPPLTFVCAWSSDARHLHHLAARLDPEQPIYGLMPPDFASKREYPETIPEWADFAQERLAAVPSDGVWRIGGYSLAGLIALELADRAERQERRRMRAIDVKNRWGDDHVAEGKSMRNAAGRDISFLRRAVQVAYLKYEAHPTQLPLALVRTEPSCARAGDDATMGWSHRIRGSFQTAVVPGSHFTLFEPEHIGEVAAAVDRVLRASREEWGGRS